MSALKKYNELDVDNDENDPVERLRAFCSLALNAQDWLDVERFFDDVIRQREGCNELVAKELEKIAATYGEGFDPAVEADLNNRAAEWRAK